MAGKATIYCCPDCGRAMAVWGGMFFWRGLYFSGLVCESCKSLHDNPDDSFFEGVALGRSKALVEAGG